VLWDKVRTGKLNGVKFHRQRPIGLYIADFYCPAIGLVIELDGGQHSHPDAVAYDEERTAHFIGRGLRVIRFINDEVLHDPERVVKAISEAISPFPLPAREREG
jgi:very-short-patch-repair endonuclease